MTRFQVDTTGSSKSNVKFDVEDGATPTEKKFVKQEGDNKVFPEIQVAYPNKFVNKDTIGCLDADTAIFQACSNVETKFITVEHDVEGIKEELKGLREFKGQTKLVSDVSWLGVLNAKRKVQGKEVLLVEDFTVTAGARLKYDTVAEAMERAKITLYTKLKEIRLQFGIENILVCIGEGDNFRNNLPTCKPYKGQRKETARPIILKEFREWVLTELKAEAAKPRDDGQMVECDDLVEYYGAIGYKAYRKTNVFSHVVISSDKDSKGNPKYLINQDKHTGKDNPKRGQWKEPQAMIIEATDRTAGGIELVQNGSKKEIKGYGCKWIIYQSILGEDSADFYSAFKHLGRKFNYGEVSAYEDLYGCKTAKEVIQKAVDVSAELLHYGVQYTTHDGVVKDVDTLEYLNTYFAVAYMLRSPSDTMTFTKLCKAFDVDVSAITDNNLLSAPVKVFNKDNAEKVVDDLKVVCDNLIPPAKGWKSLKKADKDIFVEKMMQNIEDMKLCFSDFYEMKQLPKQLKEEK